jgi:hypothetical protein
MKKARGRKQAEPSAASLREMPEVDFAKAAKSARGHHFKKAVAAGGYSVPGPGGKGARWVPLRAGRPKKGTKVEPTEPRSVRFPEELWRRLDREARKLGVTRHALLRQVVAAWLERAA